MSKSLKRNELLGIVAGVVLLAAGAALQAVHGPNAAAMALRWLAVVCLAAFAVRRKSLTPWIFVAMVAGAELGFDAPKVAVELKVFSDIFLKLIKTIVAPLILSTLVVGIAGHGDIKGVGRMGVRALIYFEVVTTLALGVGLLAINVTKAGVGLTFPAVSAAAGAAITKPVPQHWNDVLLHMFPENLAKSVATDRFSRSRCSRSSLRLRWRR